MILNKQRQISFVIHCLINPMRFILEQTVMIALK